MVRFCTLFDSGFLSRGIVLYNSLVASGARFELAVFAFDDIAFRVLSDLNLAGVTVVSLSELEDPGLLAVKPTRTRGEYCWTATSSTVLYCLETLGWPDVTYIDADLYFFANPEVLIDEMGPASVLLTSHNYAPAYDQSLLSGTFCVQFMRFVADDHGLTVARWWRERCLEWCYNRRENGKFGDQFYLEDWPTRFEGVHVLGHQGGGLAPWNISKYRFQDLGTGWRVALGDQRWEPVFYHFHGVRFYDDGVIGLDNYRLGPTVLKRIYRPYLASLVAVSRWLSERYPSVDWLGRRPRPTGPMAFLGGVKNRLWGTWNFLRADELPYQGVSHGPNA